MQGIRQKSFFKTQKEKNFMQLTYKPSDRPTWGKTIVFAIQQVLAILAATIVVPVIVGNGMSQGAALFGAGVGTLVYLLFTKFKSPVFLGSSFAFIGSMCAAFGGAATAAQGYLGIIIGAIFAGLVYVAIALVVKYAGTGWIDKIMPAAVIGPTVAVIGLSLAGNAVGDVVKGAVYDAANKVYVMNTTGMISIVCGLVTLFTVIACSVFGKKMLKMIPFIIGILAGYAVASIFTIIGIIAENPALKVINFGLFENLKNSWIPDFTFVKAMDAFEDLSGFGTFLGEIAVAYVPVAFVVFAEHLADHKNISSIIEQDLLKDPGLDRTLLGDGVGSMVGAFFGGCPNTTYGESVGCVAISGNASIVTIISAAIICIVSSFFAPFMVALATIPSCVMGGVCVALYGFIAVSGLKMIQKVNLEDNRNLFVVAVILITGIGGMALKFGEITLTAVACALILGILANLLTHLKKDEKEEKAE